MSTAHEVALLLGSKPCWRCISLPRGCCRGLMNAATLSRCSQPTLSPAARRDRIGIALLRRMSLCPSRHIAPPRDLGRFVGKAEMASSHHETERANPASRGVVQYRELQLHSDAVAPVVTWRTSHYLRSSSLNDAIASAHLMASISLEIFRPLDLSASIFQRSGCSFSS